MKQDLLNDFNTLMSSYFNPDMTKEELCKDICMSIYIFRAFDMSGRGLDTISDDETGNNAYMATNGRALKMICEAQEDSIYSGASP